MYHNVQILLLELISIRCYPRQYFSWNRQIWRNATSVASTEGYIYSFENKIIINAIIYTYTYVENNQDSILHLARVNRKFGVWTENMPFRMNNVSWSITYLKIYTTYLTDDETKIDVNFAVQNYSQLYFYPKRNTSIKDIIYSRSYI